ncbi:MAG: thiamine phosphate synthase [Thermoanaerobaculia bacterium]|nr:thiamine phosphate synthase [Thermoanaerobaculia bacterium]
MIRTPRSPNLYVIADRTALAGRDLPDAVEEIADAGVDWIQIRDKSGDDRRLFRDVEQCSRRLEGRSTRLWVDDRVDLVALLPVAGVHLGQSDLRPVTARELVGVTPWIGRSTHSLEQVLEADGDPAVDVLAVGPIFDTLSKKDAEPSVGLELLRKARQLTNRLIVAIGGMTVDNVRSVLEAGADSVVVLGAICQAEDIGRSCRRILAATAGAS